MAKPSTVHTIESLTARCVEYGPCLLWQGYKGNAGVPQVYDNKTMVSVRRVFSRLLGVERPDGYYTSTCGEDACVNPAHTQWLSDSGHMRRIVEHAQTLTAMQEIRRAKISLARKKKITPEAMKLIHHSEQSCAKVAKEIGVSKSLVARYRSGEAGNTRANNIWSGLI